MKKIMCKTHLVLVGIAGTNKDFLLSLPTIKAYLTQFKKINDKFNITLLHFKYDDTEQHILKAIQESNPDIIGFSCYIWNTPKINNMIKHFNIPIIMGGPEISENKKDGLITYINGNGEENLYKHLLNEEPIHQNYENNPSPYLNCPETIEFIKNNDVRANIETQRGCNFKCAYCKYHKNYEKIQYRNANIVLKEINLIHKSGVKVGKIVDANFFSNPVFAKKILDGMSKNKIKMKLNFDTHPAFINASLTTACKNYLSVSDSNFLIAGIGLQSINENVLNTIDRYGFNKKAFKDKIIMLSEAGVSCNIDIILGLPQDTKESYLNTIDYCIDLLKYDKNYLSSFILRVLPGTKLETIAKKEKMTVGNNHEIIETQQMSKQDINELFKINYVISKIFDVKKIEKNNMKRTQFFKTKNKNSLSNIEIIKNISDKTFKNKEDVNIMLDKWNI